MARGSPPTNRLHRGKASTRATRVQPTVYTRARPWPQVAGSISRSAAMSPRNGAQSCHRRMQSSAHNFLYGQQTAAATTTAANAAAAATATETVAAVAAQATAATAGAGGGSAAKAVEAAEAAATQHSSSTTTTTTTSNSNSSNSSTLRSCSGRAYLLEFAQESQRAATNELVRMR